MKNQSQILLITTLFLSSLLFGQVGINTDTPGSSLDVRGSVAAQYNAVTATSYNMSATDFHVSYNGTADATFNLPAAQTGTTNFKGRLYTIKNNTAFKITVVAAGTETINGSANITVAANQSVQMINTGLTGTAVTWEVLGYNSTSTTGQGCIPDYVQAGMSVSQNISTTIATVVFNGSAVGSTIPFNNTTGVFTLTAGKTYELTSQLYIFNYSNNTGGYATYYWADAATGAILPNTSTAVSIPASYAVGSAPVSLTTSIYTPSTNQTVVVKVVTTSGTATIQATNCYAIIKQLNACGSGGGGGGSVTADNGLTAAGSNVQLGGTLSQATDIATAGNNLTINGTGNVGIGTASPSTKLHINAPAAQTGFRLTDGTQAIGRVLTSDGSGNASWAVPPSSSGALNLRYAVLGSGATGPLNTNQYTDSYITLPPGKWLVNVQMLIHMNPPIITPAGQGYWIRSSFSDSSTTYSPSADIVGSFLISTSVTGPSQYTMMNGFLRINNVGTTNKTYYYWKNGAESIAFGGANGTIQSFGGNVWGENIIYAIPYID